MRSYCFSLRTAVISALALFVVPGSRATITQVYKNQADPIIVNRDYPYRDATFQILGDKTSLAGVAPGVKCWAHIGTVAGSYGTAWENIVDRQCRYVSEASGGEEIWSCDVGSDSFGTSIVRGEYVVFCNENGGTNFWSSGNRKIQVNAACSTSSSTCAQGCTYCQATASCVGNGTVQGVSICPAQAKTAREILMNGVPSVYRLGTSSPGSISLFGPNATALVVDNDNVPIVASSVYPGAANSGGKICLFSLGWHSLLNGNNDASLVSNCAKWMKGSSATINCVLHGSFGAGTNLATFTAAGCSSVSTNTWAAGALTSATLLALDMDDDVEGNSTKVEAIRAFLLRGGNLITNGLGWYWVWYKDVAGGIKTSSTNLLLAPSGIAVVDRSANINYTAMTARAVPSSESLDKTSLYYALLSAKKAGVAANLSSIASQITSLGNTFAQGLDNSILATCGQLAGEAYSSACSDVKPLVSAGNLALKTQIRKRGCMAIALALPLRYATVDWESEAALFPGVIRNVTQSTLSITINRTYSRWYSSGLWVSAASKVTIVIPASEVSSGLKAQIGSHTDVLYESDDWLRWNEVTVSSDLKTVSTEIETKFGGILYIVVPQKSYAFVATITGKISPVPVFRSGVTTESQWSSALASTTSPYSEFEATDVIFTLPTYTFRNAVASMSSITGYWQRMMNCMYDFRGIARFLYKQRYVTDIQPSVGWMHSGYPIVMYERSDFSNGALSLNIDTTTANHWGQYHEFGHNLQSEMWTFEGTVEVTNNMWSIFCGKNMSGDFHWAYDTGLSASDAAAYKTNPDFAVWKSKPFVALYMYFEVGQTYGWDVYAKLFREYDSLSSSARPVTDADKRDQWMVRLSNHVGRNLAPYFRSWGIPITDTAASSVSTLPLPASGEIHA